MRCKFCKGDTKPYGFTRKNVQRHKCKACLRTFSECNRANHYIPQWKINLIQGLRHSGYSVRQIASLIGVAQNTVEKYTEGIDGLCGCGVLLSKHTRGWCSYRYQQSARRQAVLHNNGTDSNKLPGLYTIHKCPVCTGFIEIGRIHKPCLSLAVKQREKTDKRVRVRNKELIETETLIQKIEEIINNGTDHTRTQE